MILVFGIPLFLLPDKWDQDHRIADWYNRSIGGNFYQRTLKSPLEKYLGGTFRLFSNSKGRFNFGFGRKERTELRVTASLPQGGTIEQLNEVMILFEKTIQGFHEIERFNLRIVGPQSAWMTISFKPEYENGSFPYYLKSLLESTAVNAGAADFRVFGVGRGFNNELRGEYLSTHLRMLGYNYAELWKISQSIREKLLEHMRIQNVYINSRRTSYVKDVKYFQFGLKDQDVLTHLNIAPTVLYTKLQNQQQDQGIAGELWDGTRYVPLRVTRSDRSSHRLYQLMNRPLWVDTTAYLKNKLLYTLEEQAGKLDITRWNQQYQLYVEYDFIGNSRLANRVKERMIKEIKPELPPGYTLQDERYSWWRNNPYALSWIIVAAILIIYLISAILFNSLKMAFYPLLMIPIAFVGIFLATYWLEFRFDQGGFTAFLFTAGLSVNAAIFIINDFIILRKKKPHLTNTAQYLKAFQGKIIPILLMVISTILGLLPFIIYDRNEPFWYSLAICTIAGMVFSMIGLLFWFPMMLKKIRKFHG